MSDQPVRLAVRVPVSFAVEGGPRPPVQPLHDALRALRALEVQAPTLELAESYADQLVQALERAAR